MTIDDNGTIHDRAGKFAGHLRSEADASRVLTGGGLSEADSFAGLAGALEGEAFLAAMPRAGRRVFVHIEDGDQPNDQLASVTRVIARDGEVPEFEVEFDTFNAYRNRAATMVMPWEMFPPPGDLADAFSDGSLAEAERFAETAGNMLGLSWAELDRAEGRVTLIRAKRLADLVRADIPDAKYIRLADAADEDGKRAICFADIECADGRIDSGLRIYDQARKEMAGITLSSADTWMKLCTEPEWAVNWHLDVDRAAAISGEDLIRGAVGEF